MDTGKLTGHLAALGAYTIFGLNIVFCKDIANSEAVSPVVLFTFRALGASALFWLLSLLMPREKVEKGDLPKIALAGFFGLFLTQMAFLLAIPMATAIDTAILSTLGPVFTMFFAYIFLKEPITGKKAGGVTLSLAGVIFLILNSVHAGGASTSKPLGIILLLVNSLTFALYLGKFRPLIAKYSVVTFMKWAFLFCLLLALPFSAKGLIETDYAAIPVNVRWEIGYLVFFATFVAYFLIPVGQKHLRPTLVSMYSYLQPIIAAVVSIWAGLDTLTWQKCLATVLIVGGVILVSRSRAAAQEALDAKGKAVPVPETPRKRIEVVAAIIRKGDRIFATQRGYGDWKDWWEFPGGKIEPGGSSCTGNPGGTLRRHPHRLFPPHRGVGLSRLPPDPALLYVFAGRRSPAPERTRSRPLAFRFRTLLRPLASCRRGPPAADRKGVTAGTLRQDSAIPPPADSRAGPGPPGIGPGWYSRRQSRKGCPPQKRGRRSYGP